MISFQYVLTVQFQLKLPLEYVFFSINYMDNLIFHLMLGGCLLEPVDNKHKIEVYSKFSIFNYLDSLHILRKKQESELER